jgi:5'-deoxynucleotidase YfbR-like HD superfamily hydrolase
VNALTVPQILAQRRTRRWHTRAVTRDQSVAEHAHQVALLALHLAPEDITEGERLQILDLALLHDAHEPQFGDIPFPAKQLMSRRGLDLDAWCRRAFWGPHDPQDQAGLLARALVDAADQIEAALYARDHLASEFQAIRAQTLEALAQMALSPESYCRALDALEVRG